MSETRSMMINLRVYSKYDMDLITLHENGISLTNLAKNTLKAYAYGTTVRYRFDNLKYSASDKDRSLRVCFPVTDPKCLSVLSEIKDGRRNQFLKTLIRNSLIRQNISCFFKDEIFLEKERDIIENENMKWEKTSMLLLPNTRHCLTPEDIADIMEKETAAFRPADPVTPEQDQTEGSGAPKEKAEKTEKKQKTKTVSERKRGNSEKQAEKETVTEAENEKTGTKDDGSSAQEHIRETEDTAESTEADNSREAKDVFGSSMISEAETSAESEDTGFTNVLEESGEETVLDQDSLKKTFLQMFEDF